MVTTGLLGEDRVSKDHPRIEALGALDEASAALGLARASCQASPTPSYPARSATRFIPADGGSGSHARRMRANSKASTPAVSDGSKNRQTPINMLVSTPKAFILPGDTPSGAALSLARAVVRRAERRVTELFALDQLSNPELLRYINRLSSLCFVLELLENQTAGKSTSLAKE